MADSFTPTSSGANLPQLVGDFSLNLPALPTAAQRILAPTTPVGAKKLAARGIIPGLKPGDIATVVAALTRDADPEVAQTARTTFSNLPAPILAGALESDLQESVIELFASEFSRSHGVIEHLLRMPQIGVRALEFLATAADERAGELIATNENLLLKHPTVIEKLYMNRRVRMSTADRLLELAIRNDIELNIPAYKEAAQAIRNELIVEASVEPTFDDVLFAEARAVDESIVLSDEDDTHEVDEEGEEKIKEKCVPLHTLIAQMTITQKIRKAMLGDAAARLLLVRDPNRLVAAAAAKSPNMREPEAARIAASRAVSEDVLRIISLNREFTRSYQVKLNLVTNPRTPFSFAARIIPLLRDNDLKILSKSKNVNGAISQAVRQQLQRKEKKDKG
ncbi:MAG: hypothetical protein SFV15_15135 [Polyangiaceae bacterium]|nr:hypothetical protein [Polyangiaceae bacterium]